MNKRYADLLAGFLMLFLVALLADQGVAVVREAGALPAEESPIVVVDSGHGGDDPGKIGVNQALEKDINLRIALKLKERLTAAGITVIMTRESDEGLYQPGDTNKKIADLNERCRIIDKSGAEIAVSIHQNSYHSEDIAGPQMFYYKTSVEGKRLAETLQSAFSTVTDHNTRKAKENDNYYLLLHAACPVVIAECGFLSNWEEAKLLITDEYQDTIADALCAGILEYLGVGEHASASAAPVSPNG